MIQSPIRSVLATLEVHGVPYLLMGGQACVIYGAAEFSRDLDLVIGARSELLRSLQKALEELEAERIAVPALDMDLLARGHAVHFRCHRPDALKLRIDVLTHPPRINDVEGLWARRIVMPSDDGDVPVISLPDLVATKKTQRDKDWAMINSLIEIDMIRSQGSTTERALRFWLREIRNADLLIDLARSVPELARDETSNGPLLVLG